MWVKIEEFKKYYNYYCYLMKDYIRLGQNKDI